MALDMIKNCLSMNGYLTPEIKERIMDIIDDDSNLFKQFDQNRLYEMLKTLNIKASDDRVDKEDTKYDPLSNVLFINGESVKSGNGEFLLVSGLLKAITINNEVKPEPYKALKDGVIDSMARQVAQDDDLPDRTIATIYLGLIRSLICTDQNVKGDPIIETVMSPKLSDPTSNETSPLLLTLYKNGIDMKKYKTLNDGVNYFHVLSINRPEAEIDLGSITNNIIDLCVTEEQLKALENSGYIFYNFDGRYKGLDKVKPFLDNKREALKNKLLEVEKSGFGQM